MVTKNDATWRCGVRMVSKRKMIARTICVWVLAACFALPIIMGLNNEELTAWELFSWYWPLWLGEIAAYVGVMVYLFLFEK
jgi:hypothetical protein